MNKSYYIYVSDSKIDMLYDQNKSIVSEGKERTWTTGFDWLKRETKSHVSERINRYDKISYLEKELKKYTGSIISPKEYIADSIPLHWQIHGVTTWGNQIFVPQDNTLYVIVLFGSPHNIIGSTSGLPHHSLSIMPEYVRSVCELLREKDNAFLIDRCNKSNGTQKELAIWEYIHVMAQKSIHWPIMGNENSAQKYNFLAKVLYKEILTSDYRNSHVTFRPDYLVAPKKSILKYVYMLATPLYVSVDNIADDIEIINGMRYIKLDFQMLQKKYKKINDLIRFVKEKMLSAGLEIAKFVDEAEEIVYEKGYSDDEITAAIWVLIKEYAVDIKADQE